MKKAKEKGRCIQIRGEEILRRLPEVVSSRQAMTRRVTGVQLVDLPPSGRQDVRALPMLCQSLRDLHPPLRSWLILIVARDVHAKKKRHPAAADGRT